MLKAECWLSDEFDRVSRIRKWAYKPKKAETDLSGQVKSGQRWSGQNRPTDVARDLDVVLCRSLSGQV